MAVRFCAYEAEAHLDSAYRVWQEVGWLEPDSEKLTHLDSFLRNGKTLVADVDGSVECLVHSCGGTVQHTGDPLRLRAITAVTTSWIGRRQGFATRLVADVLAEAVEEGAAVAALGMFEQGYYDRLGFGTCAYENTITFDPRSLKVDLPYRMPVRLTIDDWAEMHGAMARRMKSHGSVVLESPDLLGSELALFEGSFFGLGYRTAGRLSHFVAGSAKGEHGPYKVRFLAYETPDQLLELLGVLHALSDQVASVWMAEPPHIQLQDLLDQPGRPQMLGRQGEDHPHHEAGAWEQIRILDLDACIGICQWEGPAVSFNVSLSDPAASVLPGPWRGVGGEYTVTIGAESHLQRGPTPGLPAMTASVNAFSRMWFGVRPASSIAITDDLNGPSDLLASLDRALSTRPPLPGWDF